MSNHVLVIDTNKQPLSPCHPSVVRKLLTSGKAAVFRVYPFTIILKREVIATPEPIEIKIDPGSKTTGIALKQGDKVLFGAELTHRGQAIKNSLESRRALRRGRRARNTRYRPARFSNRTKPKGWLAPSLQYRVLTTLTWVKRFIRFVPVTSITQELVRFDLQKMENPEISGIEYQQGELQGYEVREYLLEKWDRKCSYCGAENTHLQIEHIHPKSKGGSNRISNLGLACEPCNTKKGIQAKKPDVLKKVIAQSKRPLKDAAAVNSTRFALLKALRTTGLSVTTSSGGRTKFNRTKLGLAKSHWIDAACVGEVDTLKVLTSNPLIIKSTGHRARQMCRTDKYGFPSRYIPKSPFVQGFQTGDIVKAIVTTGKKIGTYVGRVAVRSKGSFNISAKELVQGIGHKYCQILHRKDGYGYAH